MAGISRFEVPINSPTGVSAWQLPYNEIATALLSKQKAYDEQEAEMAKSQAFLSDLKSGYRTAGLPQEIQADYNTRFQNYIGQDLTKPDVKRAFVKDVASLKQDARLKTLAADIKQSAIWDNYQQVHPDIAGSAVNPYVDNGQWTQGKNADGTWQNEQQIGNWFGNITPYSDFNKPIDDAYSKVKANSISIIKSENPAAEFHTDENGETYYTSTTTGTKRVYITPDLPQWQAALAEQTTNFASSATPEARYFQAKFGKEIAQDPNFINDYISTAGGKYVYRQSEDSETTKIGKGSKGSGSEEEPKIKNDQRIVTQVLKSNTAVPKGQLPTQVINTYNTETKKILDGYKAQGYGEGVDENGFTILTPKADITPSEQSILDSKNGELKLNQQKAISAKEIHESLAEKYGFKTDIPLEDQLKDPKILEKAKQAYEIGDIKKYGTRGALSFTTPEDREKAKQDAYLTVLKSDDNFKNYVTDLEALQNGVQESGALAYPIAGSKYEGLRNSIHGVLTETSNYKVGEQGGIQYLQSNENIKDEDKEFITKWLEEKGENAVNGLSSIMWDRENGEYAALVSIPRVTKGKQDNINIKISQGKLLPGLATASQDLDFLYNENNRQVFRDTYQQKEEESHGNHGILQHPELTKAIVTTHIPTTQKLPGGQALNQGETVFTIPELPNVLLKMNSFDKLYDFLTFYNNPQNDGIKKDPAQLLQNVRNFNLQDIAVPDGIYRKYEQKIRNVSPK